MTTIQPKPRLISQPSIVTERDPMSLSSDFDFSLMMHDPLGETSPAAAELPSSLSPVLPLLPTSDDIEKAPWQESSTGLTDSLLSLDFETGPELGSTMYSSGSLSESSPVLATPTDSVISTLFGPMDGVMFPTHSSAVSVADADTTESCAKRMRLDHAPRAGLSPTVALTKDFTLFPVEEDKPCMPLPTSVNAERSANVLQLLDSLNGAPNAPLPNNDAARTVPMSQILPKPVSGPTTAELSSSPSMVNKTVEGDATKSLRSGGRRRRRDVEELLPIDAPIQPRTYRTESATSRKDSSKSAECGSPQESAASSVEDGHEMDARSMKRLSNTLAARRSRHRKAEELKRLYETIERLEKEAQDWKERCLAAERERDQALLAQ